MVLFAVAVVAAWVWGIPYLERLHPDEDYSFWAHWNEHRELQAEYGTSFLTGYEYVVERRIPCLMSYRPGYEDERWGDLLAAVEADTARMSNVYTYHLMAHEDAAGRIVNWMRSTGETKAPDERVGDLTADPDFAERVAEWEETMPEVVREECGLPPASRPLPAPRFEWPE